MSYSETETRVEGEYLIVSEMTPDTDAEDPIQEDEYGGAIHGNFDGNTQFGSIGDKSEFRKARGALGEYGDLEIDDFMEQAAVLTMIETPYEKALDILSEDFEFEFDVNDPADVAAHRAEVRKLFGERVMREYNASWPKLPGEFRDAIEAKALALAERAVEARIVGDKYAVPLSLSGYYEMTLVPSPNPSFLDMDEKDVLWVPGPSLRAELDEMPYEEAMQRAVAQAKSTAEEYANWASGDVFYLNVKVFKMEWDEDSEEFIEEADHYQHEEPVWEENMCGLNGRDYAETQLKELEDEAMEHIAELQAQPSAKPTSGMSMSM